MEALRHMPKSTHWRNWSDKPGQKDEDCGRQEPVPPWKYRSRTSKEAASKEAVRPQVPTEMVSSDEIWATEKQLMRIDWIIDDDDISRVKEFSIVTGQSLCQTTYQVQSAS